MSGSFPPEPATGEEEDVVEYEKKLPPEFKKNMPFGQELYVFNIVVEGLITHVLMLYAFLYLYPFGYLPIGSFVLWIAYAILSGIGITVGCHRYWAHKTFKANTPLRIILMVLQTAAFQKSIFKWCRDHRMHHKYMDSNADPYSSARGFMFSHILWLFQPTHPELIKNQRVIDVSDLVRDPIVRFQAKYYWELVLLSFFIIPMTMMWLIYPEMSFFHHIVLTFTRFGISLHFTFLVNSAAHIWGNKPYDKFISPAENKWVSIAALGEGWHNYHHTFPWDYKSAEFGYKYNLSTFFIHFFAQIGWAWDLKTVSHKLLFDRVNRTGDGSHPLYNEKGQHQQDTTGGSESQMGSVLSAPLPPSNYWGWGDKELRKEDMEITETVYPGNKREQIARG